MDKLRYSYSFDDVLLQPSYSDFIPSDSICETSTSITPNISLKIPFISAAMDFVTESRMAIKMAALGCIGVIHKNMNIQQQCSEVHEVKNNKDQINNSSTVDKNGRLRVLAAIGTSDVDIERAVKLCESGVDALVIDTSHGHSKNVFDIIKKLKSKINSEIIVGNVATAEAAIDLANLGVDAIKVGIGPGSICTTRIISGVGVPQFSAVLAVSQVCREKGIRVIADGGIKNSGDIAKSIAAGADAVMMGSLLAGTDESPGDIIEINGEKLKKYRGMGSMGAMKSGSAERYYQKAKSANLVAQGVEGTVRYKGELKKVISQLHGGLTSAMGYTGNRNISAMQKNSRFCLVTQSGMKEGHVHSLSSFVQTLNYNKE